MSPSIEELPAVTTLGGEATQADSTPVSVTTAVGTTPSDPATVPEPAVPETVRPVRAKAAKKATASRRTAAKRSDPVLVPVETSAETTSEEAREALGETAPEAPAEAVAVTTAEAPAVAAPEVGTEASAVSVVETRAAAAQVPDPVTPSPETRVTEIRRVAAIETPRSSEPPEPLAENPPVTPIEPRTQTPPNQPAEPALEPPTDTAPELSALAPEPRTETAPEWLAATTPESSAATGSATLTGSGSGSESGASSETVPLEGVVDHATAAPGLAGVAGRTIRPGILERPGHTGELLALAAVETLGPRAGEWARRMRELYPAADADGLARLATMRAARVSAATGVLAATAGGYAPVVEYASVAWVQASVVLRVAAAYGADPVDPERAVDLLVLLRLHGSRESARAALENAVGEQGGGMLRAHPLEGVWRLATPLAARIGGWVVLRAAARLVPGAAVLVAALTDAAATDLLAARAIAHYRGL